MSMHFIDLNTAIEMTTLYRAEKENILMPGLRNHNILPICETFNRDAFDALLAQPGCTKLRFYFGMKEGLKVSLVVVGVNENGEDMLPTENKALLEDDENNIVEDGLRCPTTCPPPSPLNP